VEVCRVGWGVSGLRREMVLGLWITEESLFEQHRFYDGISIEASGIGVLGRIGMVEHNLAWH
jgi:hypothetical protein